MSISKRDPRAARQMSSPRHARHIRIDSKLRNCYNCKIISQIQASLEEF